MEPVALATWFWSQGESVPEDVSAKIRFLADRHPELVEGSVQPPSLQSNGTDPSTPLRSAQMTMRLLNVFRKRPLEGRRKRITSESSNQHYSATLQGPPREKPQNHRAVIVGVRSSLLNDVRTPSVRRALNVEGCLS